MIAFASTIGIGISPGFEDGLPIVPALCRGTFDDNRRHEIEARINDAPVEGYVVRIAGPIHHRERRHRAAKYVRARHMRSDKHWIRNRLAR